MKLIKPHPLRASDLRGIWQLARHATGEVIDITEAMHQSVRDTMGLPVGKTPWAQSLSHRRTAGLTGVVYGAVRGISQLSGAGVQAALGHLEPWLARRFPSLGGESDDARAPLSAEREALLAALNGVMGDRLQAMGNPLATRMQLLGREGQAWADQQAQPAGHPSGLPGRGSEPSPAGWVLFIHGLCMNDLQWQISPHKPAPPAEPPSPADRAAPARVDMGAMLEDELGLQPIYLRYNSGRHVADNGAELAALLEAQLCPRHGAGQARAQPLHIVAHSMGGLLARSAIEQAQRAGMQWPQRLQHLVCLGTPHHGAPLERAGNWVDAILGALPFAAPLGRLARLRSAGITDLRHGTVLPEDRPTSAQPGPHTGGGKDRFSKTPDTRTPLPLPAGIECHTVAATTAARRSALAERLLGDGLVPLRSALGQHPQSAHRLAFAEANQRVFFGMNHFELLHRPEVVAQVLAWLRPRA